MDNLQHFAVMLIAMLYSSVGHGGATGYLAIMSFWGVAPDVMATTALTLNCLTAGISSLAYGRRGYLSMKLSLPFILISIPFAYLGATVPLTEKQFGWMLAAVLFVSALMLWFHRGKVDTEEPFVKSPDLKVAAIAGAILGFVSGALGIGGGVFLSPLIILCGWADSKTTAGCSALFIVLNSFAGLGARYLSGRVDFSEIVPFLFFALVGALIGSYYGASRSSQKGLRQLIAFVLIIAVVKMLI
ncbi:TSUP family transporter [bacterium]|nr:TSUP family transporter [bacterium]